MKIENFYHLIKMLHFLLRKTELCPNTADVFDFWLELREQSYISEIFVLKKAFHDNLNRNSTLVLVLGNLKSIFAVTHLKLKYNSKVIRMSKIFVLGNTNNVRINKFPKR